MTVKEYIKQQLKITTMGELLQREPGGFVDEYEQPITHKAVLKKIKKTQKIGLLLNNDHNEPAREKYIIFKIDEQGNPDMEPIDPDSTGTIGEDVYFDAGIYN